MTQPPEGLSPAASRKPRADAQRNRERVLEAGKWVFARRGAEATMDEIAVQAGVGPGTLYRHFPTRDALIEAVYRAEVDKLTEAGREFTATRPPLEALRAWMLLFVDHVAEKKLILPAMESVEGGSARLLEGAKASVHQVFYGLVQTAIDTGDLQADTDPGDLVRALLGVFYTTAMAGWEDSARRIVHVLLEGARTR